MQRPSHISECYENAAKKYKKRIMLKYISLLSCLLVGALSQDLADVDTEAPGV